MKDVLMPSAELLSLRPSPGGDMFSNASGNQDCNIKLEFNASSVEIAIFDSSVGDIDEALMITKNFPNTSGGVRRATNLLRRHGFMIKILGPR